MRKKVRGRVMKMVGYLREEINAVVVGCERDLPIHKQRMRRPFQGRRVASTITITKQKWFAHLVMILRPQQMPFTIPFSSLPELHSTL